MRDRAEGSRQSSASIYPAPDLLALGAATTCPPATLSPACSVSPTHLSDTPRWAGLLDAWRLSRQGPLRAGDVAALARVDLDPVAHVHEERHLDDGSRLERRRLRHVRDRVAAHA